ncbi:MULTISPECIES: SDR family oxidoreductase [Virgibacillus]|nr:MULTISPECIES: SDR family oxidoreductase [Virgibacillus]
MKKGVQSMKVLVVGANGQIGQHVVKQLATSSEHTVKAMVRKQEQADELNNQGIETVVANLEDSVDELAKAMKGSDAVIFTAGSGGSTGPDKTLLIDLDGAIKTIEAAEEVGLERYIIVSAHQSHHRENWNEKIKPYYVAKHYADRVLRASKLNYTIVRPGGLLNEPGTGKISAAENLERGSIPREDVATTVVSSLTNEKTYHQSFDLISGEIQIDDALQKL